MAARNAGKAVFDWVALSSKVPSVARAEFNGFRTRYENLRSSLASVPEKSPAIDWDFYAKTVSKAGLVESFKKQYEALKVPYPEDKESARIAAHKAEMEAEIKKEIADAHARATSLQEQLNKLKAEKPYEDMTIDEYLADKPELRAHIADDIKNHRWYLTTPGKQ
eukprot:Seg2146.1 transcript_id=Seg2146.1/GoldUCD/mRNA.D3Y31 product="ATP synthase subunit d mitochondrial" protein_id=Seg2146.1/GoldUCD/D3Y31